MAEKGAEVEKGPRRWETGSPIHLPGQLCSPAAPAELPLPADPTGRPQLPVACPCGARTLPVPGVQAGLPPLPVSMVVVADDITDIPLSPLSFPHCVLEGSRSPEAGPAAAPPCKGSSLVVIDRDTRYHGVPGGRGRDPSYS